MTTITDTTVEFTASARQAYNEARILLMNANQWAETCDANDTEETLNARREKYREMELSLHRNLVHLLTSGSEHDGDLRITRDGLGCFFWIYAKSGYHGGLIFHADYAEHGTERLPVGYWSIHT